MFGACPKFSNEDASIIAAALVLVFNYWFGQIEFDIKYMQFYFFWLFKGVLTVPCPKFGNKETRIILFSLCWFLECWFGLVTSIYKLFSLTVFRTSSQNFTLSDGMMGLRHLTLSWFPFLLNMNEFLVIGFFTWNVSDMS